MNPLWEIPKMNQSSKHIIICGLILNNQQLTKWKNAQGIYLLIYQTFNGNIKFQFYSTHFFVELPGGKWSIVLGLLFSTTKTSSKIAFC